MLGQDLAMKVEVEGVRYVVGAIPQLVTGLGPVVQTSENAHKSPQHLERKPCLRRETCEIRESARHKGSQRRDISGCCSENAKSLANT